MKKLSSKNRGVRALIVTGIAGASIVAGSLTGSIAESRPLQSQYCYDDAKVYRAAPDCTPDTRPEVTTSTTEAPETTTTEAPDTTTTEAPAETTTTVVGSQPTTTVAPGSTSTTAPRGVAGAGAARPIAAQASYAG